MANTSVSYPKGIKLDRILLLQLFCTIKVKCLFNIQKYPFVHRANGNVHWTFKCPFVHWTNKNVHWTFKCPFVHWTNGHCLIAHTLVSYPHEVMLSHITSLQLPCHCKSYMSIGQKEMSIRPLDKQKCPVDIQMSIRPLDEMKCLY